MDDTVFSEINFYILEVTICYRFCSENKLHWNLYFGHKSANVCVSACVQWSGSVLNSRVRSCVIILTTEAPQTCACSASTALQEIQILTHTNTSANVNIITAHCIIEVRLCYAYFEYICLKDGDYLLSLFFDRFYYCRHTLDHPPTGR